MEIHVHGASSQTLTGEIALSEIRNVFAEVSICPGTIELQKESLRETHLAATATRFEFPWQIGRKSGIPQFGIIWLVTAKLVFNVGYFPSGVPGPAAPPAPRGGCRALRAGRPGFSSSGPGPRIPAFYFSEIRSCGPRAFTTRPNSILLPAGFMANPALPNGRHRLKMSFISPQRMGFDRHHS